MNILNLTPHSITINSKYKNITIEPSGVVARVDMKDTLATSFKGIPVISRVNEKVVGLPVNEETCCLVSSMVLSALAGSGRKNVFAPDTGETAIRNEKGQIIAVTRLVTNLD